MGDCGQIHADVVVVAEVQELLACELCAVVGDDGISNPEAMSDVGEEQDGLIGADVADGLSLDPLGVCSP